MEDQTPKEYVNPMEGGVIDEKGNFIDPIILILIVCGAIGLVWATYVAFDTVRELRAWVEEEIRAQEKVAHETADAMSSSQNSEYEYVFRDSDGAVDLDSFDLSEDGGIQTGGKDTYVSDIGDSFTIPRGWDVTYDGGSRVVLISTATSSYGERITVSQHNGPQYSHYDPEFGMWKLSYDTEQSCMKVTRELAGELGAGECTYPVFRTNEGYPVYEGVMHWRTYVIVVDTDRFVELNVTDFNGSVALATLVDSYLVAGQ